jgi:flagellar hook assembly protein FlgD
MLLKECYMRKIIIKFLSFLMIFFCAHQSVKAQNLYINQMGVFYKDGTGDSEKYCKYTTTTSAMSDKSFVTGASGNVWRESALIEFDQPYKKSGSYSYPNSCLLLCAAVQCASSTDDISFGIDEMTFEIFKFQQGTNPLDASSSPPIKTVSLYNLSKRCSFSKNADLSVTQDLGTHCTAWDGFYNLNGEFGKTNGQYGFRAKVKTSQMTSQGTQVDIEQTSAYPGQNQIPIQINVTDIHNAISSVTAVGKATVVPAQPYNFKYQLSKDATVSIKVYATDATIGCADEYGVPTFSANCLVRTIIDSQPKVGEGNTNNPIANGDFWDGRNEHGNMVPAGAYIAKFTASSNDEWGTDVAYPATRQMTLDPLQITDIGTRPLGAYSTSYATLSYVLTEAATVFVRIYKPDTVFQDIDGTGWEQPGILPGPGALVREMVEVKQARTTVNTIWDGRDSNGVPVCDGNYVYAIYAMMPSSGQLGTKSWGGAYHAQGVYTKKLYVGTLPVIRGDVISTFSPSSTVIGSSPTAAGLEPFYFTYTPVRDTIVNLTIKKMGGTSGDVVRKIVDNEVRAARFQNKDIWDGTDDSGKYVSSGTYIAELQTIDPYVCSEDQVTTRSAIIPVDLFRTVDVRTGSLLSSASSQASISYQLSETMNMDFRIYEAGTNLNPDGWPDHVVDPDSSVVYSLSGVRPKRMNITEYWDGKDNNGNMKPDGVYPYVLKVYSTARSDQGPLYSTDKTYGYITISRGQILFNKFDVYPTIPTTYNSSEAVHLPPYSIEYSLSRQSTVTVRVVDWLSPSIVYADVVLGENRDANTQYTDYWDGKCTRNVGGEHPCTKYDFVADGSYKIQVVAEDADQIQALRQPATAFKVIDVAPLKIFDVSIREVGPDTPGVISYQVSEPMKVVTKIYEPGTNITGFQEPNGLVKRLIGVRSARTPINEIWDGTDLSMFPVDDGTYVFSIFGTTVTAAISGLDGSITGDIRMDYDTELYNLPSAYTIPVARSGSIDVCGSFENDSYFAPNPYTGNNGWFRIPVKAIGNVTLKIYNLAGDLVYSKDYGKRGADESINGKGKCNASHTHEACWPKVNNSGRELARGVYFAVLRFEAAEGSKAVCQTVKKILIP